MVVFIEFVHRHLEKYGRELRRERRYVCHACGEASRTGMQCRSESKQQGVHHLQHCDEPVVLRDHIEERLGSDRVAQKVVAMDALATQELGKQSSGLGLTGHMRAICGEANRFSGSGSSLPTGLWRGRV